MSPVSRVPLEIVSCPSFRCSHWNISCSVNIMPSSETSSLFSLFPIFPAQKQISFLFGVQLLFYQESKIFKLISTSLVNRLKAYSFGNLDLYISIGTYQEPCMYLLKIFSKTTTSKVNTSCHSIKTYCMLIELDLHWVRVVSSKLT